MQESQQVGNFRFAQVDRSQLVGLGNGLPAGGVVLSERIRRRIAERVRGRGGETLSCSFGVAGFPEDGFDFESLVSAADRALFQAKLSGRNAVVCLAAQEGPALPEAA